LTIYEAIKKTIEELPTEVTDLQVMDLVVQALKECEANRIKNGYKKSEKEF
jgi:hypothetical protein